MSEPLANHPSIAQTLQQARRARRCSQLELSLRLSVSQRHISFVETGRAKPSRALLLAWLEELEVPLTQRNTALMQAGFAPVYGVDALNALQSTPHVLDAISHLLQAHDPMPAFVLDADWQVRQYNQGARWLMQALMPELMRQTPPNAELNMIDAMLHPQGFSAALLNADEVAPAMLRMVREDARQHPPLQVRVQQLSAALKARFGAHVVRSDDAASLSPVLTSRFTSAFGELRFFSMFTTFGTPQHITLASLRIEHLFPADAATRQVLEQVVDTRVARY
jgi:transcriptional regulator with XRE-family HTH domain